MPDGVNTENQQLPILSPDLVVVEEAGGHWSVLRISPQLAQLAGETSEGARGRVLGHLFAQAAPSLPELAREVSERQAPLTGVRVRLAENVPAPMEAEVHPAGLTEDFRKRVVVFHFRPLTSAEKEIFQTFHGMVGQSPAMREVFRKIELYAPSDAAVVVTGETGTGKELVARAIHDCGYRSDGPYVAVNCSAISEDLLESELFGHEKGAFTGAVRTHLGRFERADGGTLFLDEIGDMPLHTQSKLLRVIEEGRIERVGAEQAKAVDVRLVAATNVPLEEAVSAGQFRADLYHRLSVLRIHLPPLRQRPEDIPPLTDHFLRFFSRKYGRRIHRLTSEAMRVLQSYLWPGNIRELRNVLERVFIETQAEVIGIRAFSEWIRERQSFKIAAAATKPSELPMIPPYPLTSEQTLLAEYPPPLLEAEIVPARSPGRPVVLGKEEVRRAYKSADGNLSAAARLLGVHRATLYRYMDKHKLTRRDLEK